MSSTYVNGFKIGQVEVVKQYGFCYREYFRFDRSFHQFTLFDLLALKLVCKTLKTVKQHFKSKK